MDLQIHKSVVSETDYLNLVSGALPVKYTPISATPVSHVENTQITNEQKNVGRSRVTRSRVTHARVGLGVMICRSMDNKSDYIFDHMVDNNPDIMALTETWLSNDETKCRRVVMDCAANQGWQKLLLF